MLTNITRALRRRSWSVPTKLKGPFRLRKIKLVLFVICVTILCIMLCIMLLIVTNTTKTNTTKTTKTNTTKTNATKTNTPKTNTTKINTTKTNTTKINTTKTTKTNTTKTNATKTNTPKTNTTKINTTKTNTTKINTTKTNTTKINTTKINEHIDTELNPSTRGLQCSRNFTRTKALVSRKDWDFRLFTRPQFLKNFKNPCFFQNITLRLDGRKAVTGQSQLRCLPYFLIAGFPKAGTTDLWTRLSNHPHIQLKHIKEPRFFNIGRYKEGSFGNAALKYISLFDRSAEEIHRIVAPVEYNDHPFPYHHAVTGEANVDNSFDNKYWPLVPGNEHCAEPVITNADYVYHINPNMKIIFMVRNPVERLYSDYIFEARFIHYPVSRQLFHEAVIDTIKDHMDCRKHSSIRACAYNGSIETFKIRLRVGMYNIFIADWLKVFPSKNILVVKAEDTSGPKKAETYKRILDFLNIRPLTKLEEVSIFRRGAMNVRNAAEKKHGEMLPETRTLVEKFYEPFNEEFAKMYPDIQYNSKKMK